VGVVWGSEAQIWGWFLAAFVLCCDAKKVVHSAVDTCFFVVVLVGIGGNREV
jgi:hypothetical protein